MENGGGDGTSASGIPMGFVGGLREGAHPRFIRLTVQDHHRLLETLRACAEAAESTAVFINEPTETTAQSIGSEETTSLSEERSNLMNSLSRALQALELVTDEERCKCSTRVPPAGDALVPTAHTVARVSKGSARRLMRKEQVSERRRHSSNAAGHLTRSNTSLTSRRQRCSRRRDRENRVSKRTSCGVMKIILKNRNAESEPRKQPNSDDSVIGAVPASRSLSYRSEQTNAGQRKRSESLTSQPRTPLNLLNSKPLKPAYINSKKMWVKEMKSSLEKCWTPEPNRMNRYKNTCPLNIGMLTNNKALKERRKKPKLGVLGIRMSVADPFDEDSYDSKHRNGEVNVRVTRRGKTNSRFTKTPRDRSINTHQFQVWMM